MRIRIGEPKKVYMDPNPWGSVNKGKKILFVMWRILQYIVHFVNCILNNKNKTMNGNSSVLSVFVSTNSAWILTMDMFWTRLLVKEVHFCKRNILERLFLTGTAVCLKVTSLCIYIYSLSLCWIHHHHVLLSPTSVHSYCTNVCLYVLMFAYMY